MSSCNHKHYHDAAFDPKKFVDTYFSDERFQLADESQGCPIEQLHKECEEGRLDGEIMIDFSVGATVSHMIPVSRKFSKIYVVDFTEANICEFKKWLNKEPGCCSFSYGAKLACKLEGCSGESWKEKEDRVRQAIAGLIKWDVFEKNHMVPADLPQADAVLSVYALNAVSKTKEDFQSNLDKLCSLLKVGGRLLLFSPINMTFYKIDDEKFFALKVDEDFVKQAVRKAGIAIEREMVLPSKKNCHLADYDSITCIIGRKDESWEEKEDRVRQAIAGQVKWDVFEDDHTVPAVLPQADAVLSVYAMNVVSKTEEDFQRNLKKLFSLLKVGGHLIMFSPINMTFYKIDDEKFFVLKVDEDFVKQAVRKAGIAIEREMVLPSKKNCPLVDYDSIICIIGRKE